MTSQTKKSASPSLNNNYAAPNTPIASIKRPRGKKEVDLSPLHPPRAIFREADETPEPSPTNSSYDEERSWMNSTQRKVNALFSPVLHFLNGKDPEEENPAVTDIIMEEVISPSAANVISPAASDPPPATSLCTTNSTNTTTAENASLIDADSLSEDNCSLEDDGVSLEDSSDDGETEFNPYLFIKQLPAYETVALPIINPALPPKDPMAPPISLILDLDETLVHCTVEPTPNSDLIFPVTFNNISYQVHVKKRPHLESFLRAIKGKFEVVVFTASQRVYADELLDRIDPHKKYIQHRIFRDSCLPVEGNYLKDLNILGRCLKKTVLVDNSPHAFGYQVDNGIPIESWFDDPDDTELLKLEQFLTELHGAEDVREVVKKTFNTRRLIHEA
eukprot:CAMPEP_0172486414 /NCGR_PEP_ID=MMETSP1066-20121228/14993_1 /TAXON_ID=671091 /ORGANISM="Coscinodiscus wailesii, Strain CCMP2513" /LENGTH=389 /DNA_ID=CAMNT_0013252359 /DNA_START=60 /DNA_END=1229 /DNA_ORIENTATION=-